MRNTRRHDTESIMKPPRNGPNAVAMPASPDQAPIAAPRSDCRNDAEMMARLPGMSSAAVMPCSARAAMSASIDGATPLSSDVAANPTNPMMKTRRRPKRSPRDPPMTSSDPRVRR